MADKDELKTKIEALDRKIAILEWDRAKDQINPGKMAQLNVMKKKREELASEMTVDAS